MSSHVSSSASVEALLALAQDFGSRGEQVQSAKCLEAVLQRSTSLMPLTEVHARLRLALLLMDFTDNVQAAKMHLERAVRCGDCRANVRVPYLRSLDAASPPRLALLLRRCQVPRIFRACALLRVGRRGAEEGAECAAQRTGTGSRQPQAPLAHAQVRAPAPPLLTSLTPILQPAVDRVDASLRAAGV